MRPIKHQLRHQEIDPAKIERLWADLRAREVRHNRPRTMVKAAALGIVAIGGAASAMGYFHSALSSRQVLAQSGHRVRVRVLPPLFERAGVRVESSADVVAWIEYDAKGEAVITLESGALNVDSHNRYTVRFSNGQEATTHGAGRFGALGSDAVYVAAATQPVTISNASGVARTLAVGESYGQRATWLDRARSGDFSGAWAMLGREGVLHEAKTSSPSEKMLLADLASFGDDHSTAVLLLREIVESSRATSTERALAAFDLGRKEFSRAHYTEAAAALSSSLGHELPADLQANAAALAELARSRAGRP